MAFYLHLHVREHAVYAVKTGRAENWVPSAGVIAPLAQGIFQVTDGGFVDRSVQLAGFHGRDALETTAGAAAAKATGAITAPSATAPMVIPEGVPSVKNWNEYISGASQALQRFPS